MTRCLLASTLLCGACLNPVDMGKTGTSGGSGSGGNDGGACAATCVPVQPASLDFAEVPVGQASTETLTFTDCGAQNEEIVVSAPTGPNAADFVVSGLSTLALVPCQSGTVSVTFTPSGSSNESADLGFSPCSGCSPQSVALTGGPGIGCGFAAPSTYAAGPRPYAVAVADFNGDGQPDIAVVNDGSQGPGSAGVLLNQGGGTFGAPTTYPVGTSPVAAAAGDFNGDGRPDLAVVNGGDGTVSVLINQATAGFLPQPVYDVGASPGSLAVGDFDGDGHPDLAVTNGADGTMGVLLNRGDGTFASQVTYAVGVAPDALAVGDFNGDGKLDIAVTNGGSEASTAPTGVNVFLNEGGGTFAAAAQYSAGVDPSSIALGDFNGDGKLDIAVGNNFASIATLSIFLNQGAGSFAAAVAYDALDAPIGGAPSSLAVGDFNGDGLLDIAAANQAPNATDSTVGVFLNAGSGSFASEAFYTAGYGLNSVAAADLDGNGSLDLVVADEWTDEVTLLFNGCPAASQDGQVACTPNPISFGSVPAGSSRTMAVTCTNTGTEAVRVDGVGTYSGTSVFALSGLPSIPYAMSPSQSFTFSVAYSPTGGVNGDSDELLIDWTVANPSVPSRQYVDPLTGQTGPSTSLQGIATVIAGNGDVLPDGGQCMSSCLQDGPGSSAWFDQPTGLAIIGQTLYVAESINFDVRSVDLSSPEHTVATVAGNPAILANEPGQGMDAGFILPTGLLAYDGELLVGTFANISDITFPGDFVGTFAGPVTGNSNGTADGPFAGSSPARFAGVAAMVYDGNGAIYSVDYVSARVRHLDLATQTVTTVLSNNGVTYFEVPYGLVDLDGQLFVTDTNANYIKAISLDAGTVTTVAGNGGAAASGQYSDCSAAKIAAGTCTTSLSYPYGLCTDGTTIYVMDGHDHAVRWLDPVTHAMGTVVNDAGLDNPSNCVWDADAGVLYVSDDSSTLSVPDPGGHGNKIWMIR